MAADINSAELCLKAIQVLKEGLASAKKSLLNSDTCTVNRTLMQAQLEYLEDNLPDTVAKAAELLSRRRPSARKPKTSGSKFSKTLPPRRRIWSTKHPRKPSRSWNR